MAMNHPNRMVTTGRVLSALAILFLTFDVGVKLVQLPVVAETLAALGYPSDLGLTIGIDLHFFGHSGGGGDG